MLELFVHQSMWKHFHLVFEDKNVSTFIRKSDALLLKDIVKYK